MSLSSLAQHSQTNRLTETLRNLRSPLLQKAPTQTLTKPSWREKRKSKHNEKENNYKDYRVARSLFTVDDNYCPMTRGILLLLLWPWGTPPGATVLLWSRLFICLPVCQSVCLPVCCPSVCLCFYMYVCQSVSVCVCLSVKCLTACLCLCISLSVCLCIFVWHVHVTSTAQDNGLPVYKCVLYNTTSNK